VPSGGTTFRLVGVGLLARALRQAQAHDVAEVSGVMRPWLPLIKYSDLITRAPASDRGRIQRHFAGFAITPFQFGSCSRNTDARSLIDLAVAAA
jgi:hypothetical protein